MRSSGGAVRRLLVAVVLLGGGLAGRAEPPAPLRLSVDTTEAPRGRFRVELTLPVSPGKLTLAYPQWIQGEHAPNGPINQLVGLALSAEGRPVPWRRDPLDLFRFQVEIPVGARTLTARYDYLAPVSSLSRGYGNAPNATPHLLIVDWHDLVLYPAGQASDALVVEARLRLPRGWGHDAALAAVADAQGSLRFPPMSLTTLLDSPVLAGEFVRTEVVEAGPPLARLTIAADRPSALVTPPERLVAYRRMPPEARALLGPGHHRAYAWLVSQSDALDPDGLEHHESTDIRRPLRFLVDEQVRLSEESTLPHEYVHSWNGKYRRPAGLTVATPNEPLETELLWVYEGLTRYLGDVILAARSGIHAPEESREHLAWRAGVEDRNAAGRRWRPLVDTAASAQIIYATPTPEWSAARRPSSYYNEGMLIWLEADTLIRERTKGRRSLDDFCLDFFGGPERAPAVRPYSREDVEAALARLLPFDWHGFFEARVYAVAPAPPLEGLARAGWRLVYTPAPNAFLLARAASNQSLDYAASLGMVLDPSGKVKDVAPDSLAWLGGVDPGMKVLAVDGQRFSPQTLREAVAATGGRAAPLELVVEQREDVRTLRVDYHGGLLFPHLERDPSRPDLLSAILAPRAR